MSGGIKFDATRTAIMCMDLQTGIVFAYGGIGADELLSRAANLLEKARAAGMIVIYIQVGFRPGFPEISENNGMFSLIKSESERQKMFDGPAKEIHPAVAPESGDIVITKHRVSAFYATDLEMILRANNVDTLVLFGISTSRVVLSTLTNAVDLDYKLFVIEDLCADRDQELHESMMRFYALSGTVISSSEFIEALAAKK